MQVAALFLPTGSIKKTSTKKTPEFVEKRNKPKKICMLLKGRIDGNKKNTS
mgnify:CR=1 FL=1